MSASEHNHRLLPFGRRVSDCPRCEDLKDGTAQPRPAWGSQGSQAQYVASGQTHRCTSSCPSVCTAGDW